MRILAFSFLASTIMLTGRYINPGTVTDISGDLVTFTDESGEAWKFYGDGYEIGQQIKAVMDTNKTPGNIYDDKVVNIF
jgi:hypothetical protein